MSLLLKIVEGSNTAVFLPAEGKMRFLLPQLPGSEYNAAHQEVRFLEVDIPMTPERMAGEEFLFTDQTWDALEAAQGEIDDTLYPPLAPPPLLLVVEGAQGGAGEVITSTETVVSESMGYTDVTVEECPASALYQEKVGDTFFDSEDSLNFKIAAVCTSATHSPGTLFFRYFDADLHPGGPPAGSAGQGGGGGNGSGDVCEYTPCEELMAASWVTWSGEQQDWVQCVACNKWRKLPSSSPVREALSGTTQPVKLGDLPDDWECGMATWLGGGGCAVPQEEYGDVVSVSEGVNGVLVPVTATSNSTASSDANASVENGSAGDDGDAGPDNNVVYTVDLQTAVRHIVSALKGNVGNKLLTRLSPETTHGVLSMALQDY
jgi:hypothetical protein